MARGRGRAARAWRIDCARSLASQHVSRRIHVLFFGCWHFLLMSMPSRCDESFRRAYRRRVHAPDATVRGSTRGGSTLRRSMVFIPRCHAFETALVELAVSTSHAAAASSGSSPGVSCRRRSTRPAAGFSLASRCQPLSTQGTLECASHTDSSLHLLTTTGAQAEPVCWPVPVIGECSSPSKVHDRLSQRSEPPPHAHSAPRSAPAGPSH